MQLSNLYEVKKVIECDGKLLLPNLTRVVDLIVHSVNFVVFELNLTGQSVTTT